MGHRETGPLIAFSDIPTAISLLTRLPIGGTAERGAAAAWAYPLVGVIIAVICAAFIAVMKALGVPPGGMLAAPVLVLAVVLTGALHEDGLADTADGLWGGSDRKRRLEIMKDSQIGVYGVLAIALSLLLRWTLFVGVIITEQYWVAFITAGVLSRAGMVAVMSLLPHARDGGLSKSVGRPGHLTAGIAVGSALIIALICYGPAAVPAILVAVAAVFICGLIANTKIGGQTGDILGATQQVTEIVVLFVLVNVAM